MLRLICAATVLVARPGPVQAARWDATDIGIPLLRTFAARETGTFAPYRCALPARDGRLYVGHDGLLAYDGESWSAMPLPEKTIVRTLAEAEDGRIWVGGENLLGSLVWKNNNTPEFVSAIPLLPTELRREPGSIGAVFPLPGGQIIAVAETRVYNLRPQGTQVWSLPSPRRLVAWRDRAGTVFVAQPGTATWRVSETGLEPAAFPEPYASAGIEWAVDFPDGSRLLGAGPQLLRQHDNQIDPVTGPAAALVRDDRVTSAMPLAQGFVALATLRHGILVLDHAGQLAAQLDHRSDLPDDRIVHLASRGDGAIVVTTPETLALFSDEFRATVFDGRHGLETKRVTGLLRNDTGLYLANGQRLLRLDRDGRWQPRAESAGALGALRPVANQILGYGAGDLTILDPGAPAGHRLRPADVQAVGPWSAVANGLAWVEGGSFYRGQIAGDRLQPAGPPLEIEGEACSLVEDAAGAHWIATVHSGVVRVASADQIAEGRPALRRYRDNLRSLSSFIPNVFRVGPHLLATTETGLALYTEAGDRFRPSNLVSNVRIHAVSAPEPDGTVWLALSQHDRLPEMVRLARLRPEKHDLVCELVRLPPLAVAEPPTTLFVEDGAAPDTHVFWLGQTGRVVRIESCGGLAAPPPVPHLAARAIFDDDRGSHPLAPVAPSVEFNNTGLRFDVSVPGGRLAQRVHLETRLAGFDPDWVPLGEIPSRVFRGLRDGNYRFEARSIDALGHTSPAALLEFAVLPPWWRSALAYCTYALGLVLFSGLVFYTRLRLARTHRRDLEALVAQRTRELAAANAAKSEFLAHINHEIRNPLNGVIGLSAMLAHHHQDEDTRRLARSLRACAGYLGSVVDNVLDLARIEAGRIEITPLHFDPRTLVEDIAEMFRPQIEEGGGRISWSVDPALPSALRGDVHRIRQVLVNFTANAARYARGGDVRLTIRQRTRAHHRLTVVFTVADSGPGIAPDEQARIFEKFTRGSSAGGDTPRGYGVGLALVRDLAELLGGEADVDSQIGHGAKFRLTVPLEIPPVPEPAAGPAARSASPALRVLVIDDQAFNRLVLRDHLERFGCKVEESADGPSAHLLLQARAHHLAFVDLDLPGLDGLALIRRVRAETAPQALFLVATTASATRGVEEQALAAGADAFLPKPLSLPSLSALLETCARRLPLAATPPPAPAETPPPRPAGLFAALPLTPALIRNLHTELDVETQSLVTSWRHSDRHGARRHAHRIASLAIIAQDDKLLLAARHAESALDEGHGGSSPAVEALQTAARTRLQLLVTTVAATGQDRRN